MDFNNIVSPINFLVRGRIAHIGSIIIDFARLNNMQLEGNR
jgi:hypothetical protein